jgi:hypothetical protein
MSVYPSSCDYYGHVLLHVVLCVVECRVMVHCCALWPFLWVVCESMDRAFEPVERTVVRTLRLRARLAMAVTPSISLPLCFSCLHRITIVNPYSHT